MLRRRVAGVAGDGWQPILAILAPDRGYDERIDAVLERVSELSGLPDAYLYVTDPGGRHLHLDRARARPAGDPTRAAPAPGVPTLEGGVEATAPMPPLEVLRSPEDERDRPVATTVGRLWSLALPSADGALLGTVQVGPLVDERVPTGLDQALAAVRFPVAHVIERARAEQALAQRLASVSAQLEAGQRLAGSALSFDRFVELLLDMARRTTRSDAGFVAVVAPGGGGLGVQAQTGMPDGFAERVDLAPDTGLFDWSPAGYGGALILRDVDAAVELGIRSLLAVPLTEGDEPLGVIALANFGVAGTFEQHSLELLESFAEQIRLMLHNRRLFGAFADRYLETVMGLARSLDARRPHSTGHHERMAAVAATIAAAIGEPPPVVEAIRTAGLVHDVGLAASAGVEGGVDADLEHPTVGATLLEHLPLHPAVAESVATHHEWFDGWGFPVGLSGDAIPLGGRVLGFAEFLAEMKAGDEVRAPWDDERLAAEVARRRGSQFDPRVADAGLRLLAGGGLGPHGAEHHEREGGG